MPTSKKKFFIGSSRKYMLYADALKQLFDNHPTIEAVTWSDYFKIRGGGRYTYDSLIKGVSEIEFAVFFITSDWKLENKDPSHAATPNIWFEAGMFMSRYGKENVLIIEQDRDSFENKIQYSTDLMGLQPQYYELKPDTKRYLSSVKKIPNWTKLKNTFKRDILSALGGVKKKIEENINDDTQRIFDTISSIKNRKQCYVEGERIINNASEYLFSIVSYEDEYDDPDYPNGLFPYIEKKLEELKTYPSMNPYKCKKFFKRWMNLANEKIAEQAKYILDKHADFIEIKDTYCNFIEVVISEQEVLIVLPKPEKNKTVIGKGVLIKSADIAREFINWFESLIPEHNNFLIDTPQKLKKYRKLKWNLHNRRMEGDNYRCNACVVSFDKQPVHIQKWLKKTGLINHKDI